MTETIIDLIVKILGAVPAGYEFLLYIGAFLLLIAAVFSVFFFILLLFSKILKF